MKNFFISIFHVTLNCKSWERLSKFENCLQSWGLVLLHYIRFAMCRTSTFQHQANFLKIATMQSLSCTIYDANATKLVSFPGPFEKHNEERYAYSLCFTEFELHICQKANLCKFSMAFGNIFHFTWFICYLHFAQFISHVICLNNTKVMIL